MTIKERVAELNRLRKEEDERHGKRAHEFFLMRNKITRDCPHTKTKDVQTSIEKLTVCVDCGDCIF